MRRLAVRTGAALLLALGATFVSRRLWPYWQARIAVVGHSMEPTLLEGDWLLVDPYAYQRATPRAKELVVARDPRAPDRVLIKRVAGVGPDGEVTLAGDHPAHGADAAAIGTVRSDLLLGRPLLRYWPPERFGRIH
jgi:nickel-type superoxide dismutase maturation protease